MSDLRALSDAATPGPWSSANPPDGPGESMFWGGDGWTIGNTFMHRASWENYVDACRTKGREPLESLRVHRPDDSHQTDAAFIVALVNAYREGRLIEAAALAEPKYPGSADQGAPCWFCGRSVGSDYLIAGYDTFDEQRLACLDCDRAIHALREKGWLREVATPAAEPGLDGTHRFEPIGKDHIYCPRCGATRWVTAESQPMPPCVPASEEERR